MAATKTPPKRDELSVDILKQAKRLLRRYSWNRVAAELGVSRFKLFCALRPGYRERYNNETKRRWRESFSALYGESTKSMCGFKDDRRLVVPSFVEEERARASAYKPDLTAAFFGDPPPWRSALGRRNETRENP